MVYSPVDYLLIGHLTVDLLPNHQRALGGTVSYATRTAHAFGLKVGVVTSCAADEPLLAGLTPYAQVHVIPAPATSTFENIYTPQGREQYIRARAASLSAEHVPQEWRQPKLLHLGPIADEVDPQIALQFTDAIFKLATPQGWFRAWDQSGKIRFKSWFDAQVCSHLQLLVFSEEDIREDPSLEKHFTSGVTDTIITRADQGGSLYNRNQQRIDYISPTVEVVNPTGAGDVFAASMAISLTQGHNWKQAFTIAARLAATCVTRYGLDGCPTPDEVRVARVKTVP
jgi:sugar/nucleoside kinase (ribokinase family)